MSQKSHPVDCCLWRISCVMIEPWLIVRQGIHSGAFILYVGICRFCEVNYIVVISAFAF
ncbi:hypothetical protein BJX70DRAFT_370916 [Aspergillus crustosus]